jgi:cell division protein FtsN
MRRTDTARRLVAASLLPLMLAACGAVRSVDERLRQVEVLDRIFDPEGVRQRAAARATPDAAPTAEPVATSPLQPEPIPEPAVVAAPLPDPEPEPVREAVPERPAAPPRIPTTEARLRESPWLSRFWTELTPDQQGRVTRAFARRGALPANLAASWDPLGLRERVRLVYGNVAGA